MKLSLLIKNMDIVEVINYQDINIESITDKASSANENSIFCCLVGEKIDGHQFVNELIKKGVKVFLVEKELENLGNNIIQIVVKNTREQICILASNYYGNCHNKMDIIGVTGTNGKTSITFMLKNAFEMLKNKVGIIGTTGYYIGNRKYDTSLTTPDPIDLHRIFYEMYNNGVKVIIMEVSAHSIYLKKIFGIKFKYGILTNITQDHLDYFKTMDNYANCKLSFLKEYCDCAIINRDDKYTKRLNFDKKYIYYSINKKSKFQAKNIKIEFNKLSFKLNLNNKEYKFIYKNFGLHNIYNILPCIIILKYYGYSVKKIKQAVLKLSAIKGRLDIVENMQYTVCIDYAHTPDALYNVLKSLRPFTNDLIVIFGSSGNRDSLKRFKMGTIVNKYADFIIITSDNPRYEKINDIIYDLSIGITKPFAVEQDRSKAVQYALQIASKDSIIVLCGKGVEEYQDIRAKKVEYSDYCEIKKYTME